MSISRFLGNKWANGVPPLGNITVRRNTYQKRSENLKKTLLTTENWNVDHEQLMVIEVVKPYNYNYMVNQWDGSLGKH